MSMIFSAVVFACVLLACVGAMHLVFRAEDKRREDMARRLGEIGPPEVVARAAAVTLLKKQSFSDIPLIHRLLSKLPSIGNLELFLYQAGTPCNPGTLVLLSATLCVVAGIIGSLQGSFFFVAGGCVAGAIAPVWWISRLKKKRMAAFEEQFSESVDLMARALRAGHGMSSALQMVGQEMEDPISEEFNRTFSDYTYGKSMEEALLGMVHRVDCRDVKFFATAVIMQRETGGNLTEILENLGYIVRERFRLVRQLKALSAEGRLSGRVLGALAPSLLVLLWFASPKYLITLFEHPLGQHLMMAGAIFQIMGMLIIKRLTTFKI